MEAVKLVANQQFVRSLPMTHTLHSLRDNFWQPEAGRELEIYRIESKPANNYGAKTSA